MLPLRPPVGKPAPLACTYAATGHNSAVLSLDVTEDLMVTGSKGLFYFFTFIPSYRFCFGKLRLLIGVDNQHYLIRSLVLNETQAIFYRRRFCFREYAQ